MKELYLTEEEKGISGEQLEKMLNDLLVQYPDAKKVLIIPPDYTRCYSYAGEITQLLYKKLSPSAQIDVMPALGTHMAMNEDEMQKFFGDVVQGIVLSYITGRQILYAWVMFRQKSAQRSVMVCSRNRST